MFAPRKFWMVLVVAVGALALQIEAVYAAIIEGGTNLVNYVPALVPALPALHPYVWSAVFLTAACLGVASIGRQPALSRNAWQNDE